MPGIIPPPNPPRRFPCGDFFPGEQPRPYDGEINTSIPPLYIPSNGRAEPVFFPTDKPLDPRGPANPNPPMPGGGRGGRGFGPGGPAPSNAGPATPGPAGPAAPGPGGAPPGKRGPVTPGPGGPAAPGPAGPATPGGGPVTPGRGGPVTPTGGGPAAPGPGGGQRVFRQCTVRVDRCTDPTRTYTQSELERLPIKQIVRYPTICTFEKATFDGSAGYPFALDSAYTDEAKNFCLANEITTADFWAGCISDQPNNCAQVEPNNNQSVISVGRITTSVTQAQNLLAGVNIPNSSVNSQTIIRTIPTRLEEDFNSSNSNILRQASTSSSYNTTYGLFDEKYNFFKTNPQASTTLVSNSNYRDIFKDVVAEEVKYFIDRQESLFAWSEEYFDSLTSDKIIISLRDELLITFNNITSIGRTKIPFSDFIEVIKNHLITGTLSEFDPNYFYYIYNSQVNVKILRLPQEGESYNALQIALGLFELSSQSPYQATNPSNLKSVDELKRIRFLLEDIEANIPSLQIDGNSSPLFLRNAGIPSDQLVGSPSAYLNIGDGAGYYISSTYVDGALYPLQTVNELSASRYIPPNVRENLLKLLGTDIGLKVTVDSQSNLNEFSPLYNPSADVSPMYFKLNLESISDIDNPNSVINILSATYQRISDDEAINHSRNYSFNISKINLDYRDPIIHYARDTSNIFVELDEFNLRNFDQNRSIVKENIILRNLPAAIILTPGMGSAHNPFNSKSKIISFTDSVISRSINLTPSFEIQSNFTTKPSLEVCNIYNSIGTPHFGLYEQMYSQDIHGNLFTYSPSSSIFNKSYFSGSYSNTQPDLQFRSIPIESKLVSLVDKLSDSSSVSSLTWWDVFRRVNINDIGKLAYCDPKTLLNKLASGWRNDTPILNVLTRYTLKPSGIPEEVTIENDNIIINEWDR